MEHIPIGPICQSCGISMSIDGGGTEMDGMTKSMEYCALCYRDGRFIDSDMTVDDMILRSQGRMQKLGMPEPVIEKNLMRIYSLDRWSD